MQCCGVNRSSQFCPDCGKKLEVTPKSTLVAFLEKAIKRYETDVQKCKGRMTAERQGSATIERRTQNLLKAEKTLTKYREWLGLALMLPNTPVIDVALTPDFTKYRDKVVNACPTAEARLWLDRWHIRTGNDGEESLGLGESEFVAWRNAAANLDAGCWVAVPH